MGRENSKKYHNRTVRLTIEQRETGCFILLRKATDFIPKYYGLGYP